MKRDWNKIDFWMAWFFICLIIFIASIGVFQQINKTDRDIVKRACLDRGLMYYNKNNFECIGRRGEVYDIQGLELTSQFKYLLITPLIIFSFIFGFMSFLNIYEEYNKKS